MVEFIGTKAKALLFVMLLASFFLLVSGYGQAQGPESSQVELGVSSEPPTQVVQQTRHDPDAPQSYPGQEAPPPPLHTETFPRFSQFQNQLNVILIDDQAGENQYVTTLESSGMQIPGSSPGVVFGVHHSKDRNRFPMIWYPHGRLQDITRLMSAEPESAFRGISDFTGSLLEGKPASLTLPSPEFSNLLFSEEAFQHFQTMAVGSSQSIKLREQLQGSAEREIQSTVLKQGQITLRRPAQLNCREDQVEGTLGWVCPIREVHSELTGGAGGDIHFVLRLKGDSADIRYRVAQQWYPGGTPLPLSEFMHSQYIELFIPVGKMPQNPVGPEIKANKNLIKQGIEAGFYSASRHSKGDRFALKSGLGIVSEMESHSVLSRLEFLMVEDEVSGNQYVTTLSKNGGRESQSVQFYGVHYPSGGERPAEWYPGERFNVEGGEALWFPGEYFIRGSRSSASSALGGTLTESAWQRLREMTSKESLFWRFEQKNSQGIEQLISHVVKHGQLMLTHPSGLVCRSEQVEGVEGRVCLIRGVSWQGRGDIPGELRFSLRSRVNLPDARYRVAEQWVRLGESIPAQAFIQSQGIEFFYVPEDTVRDGYPTPLDRESNSVSDAPLQMSFFMPGRMSQGDRFSVSISRKKEHSPATGIRQQRLPLLLITDTAAQKNYVTTLGGSQGCPSGACLYGAQHPGAGERPAAWYLSLSEKVDSESGPAPVLQPAEAFSGFIDSRGHSTHITGNPVLSPLAWQQLSQMATGTSQLLTGQVTGNSLTPAVSSLAIKAAHLTLNAPATAECQSLEVEGVRGQRCVIQKISVQGDLFSSDLQWQVRGKGAASSLVRYRAGLEWHPLDQAASLQELKEGGQIELFIPAKTEPEPSQQHESGGRVFTSHTEPMPLSGVEIAFYSSSRVIKGDRFTLPVKASLFTEEPEKIQEIPSVLSVEEFKSQKSAVDAGETLQFKVILNRTVKTGEQLYLKIDRQAIEEQTAKTTLQPIENRHQENPPTLTAPLDKKISEDLALDKADWQGNPLTLKEGSWIALPLAPEGETREFSLTIPVLKEAQTSQFLFSISRELPLTQLRPRSLSSLSPATRTQDIKTATVSVYALPPVINDQDGSYTQGFKVIKEMTLVDERSAIEARVTFQSTDYSSAEWGWTPSRGNLDDSNLIAITNSPDTCLKDNIEFKDASFYSNRHNPLSVQLSNLAPDYDGAYILMPKSIQAEPIGLSRFTLRMYKNVPPNALKGGKCSITISVISPDPNNSGRRISHSKTLQVDFDKQDYLFKQMWGDRLAVDSGQTVEVDYTLRRATKTEDKLKFAFANFAIIQGDVAIDQKDVRLNEVKLIAQQCTSGCPKEVSMAPFEWYKNNETTVPVGTTKLKLKVPINGFGGNQKKVLIIFTAENNNTGIANPTLLVSPKTAAWVSGFENSVVDISRGEDAQFIIKLDVPSFSGQTLNLRMNYDPVIGLALLRDKASAMIGGNVIPLNFQKNDLQTLSLPTGTKEILVKIPTKPESIGLNGILEFTLTANTVAESGKAKTATGRIYPSLTQLTWRAGTQDGQSLELIGSPDKPWLASRVVRLKMSVESAFAHFVDLTRITPLGEGISPSELDLSAQKVGELKLTPAREFTLQVPRYPIYLHPKSSELPAIQVYSYDDTGKEQKTSIPLDIQSLPLSPEITGEAVPWGKSLKFKIVPHEESLYGATLTLKVSGAQNEDINWTQASLFGEGMLPIEVGDLSGENGQRIDIKQKISGPLTLVLPTQRRLEKQDRLISLQAEGGTRLSSAAARGQASILGNVLYVTQVEGQEGQRGGHVQFTVHLNQLPKVGEKLYFKLAFPSGSHLSLTDFDLSRVEVRGERWTTAKYLSFTQGESVMSLENGQTNDDKLTVRLPVLYPATAGPLKGGAVTLFVAGGETENESLGTQGEAKVAAMSSMLSIVDTGGATTSLQLSGDMDKDKFLQAGREVRLKVENVDEGDLQQQLLLRAIRERSGIKLVWNRPDGVESSGSSCLFKVVKGTPLDAQVPFQASLAFSQTGKRESLSHNCSSNMPIDLRAADWQVSHNSDKQRWEAVLPFDIIFRLDAPESQKTLDGLTWLGQAELNTTLSVQSVWNSH